MTSRAPLAISPIGQQIFQAIEPGASQTVALSSSSVQSTAMSASTTIVRLVSDQNCFIKFGSSPTATSADMYLVASTPEYFGITGGWKIAAIEATADGTLWITEGSL